MFDEYIIQLIHIENQKKIPFIKLINRLILFERVQFLNTIFFVYITEIHNPLLKTLL